MNIEKFNDEEMYLKANVKFNNGDCETILRLYRQYKHVF